MSTLNYDKEILKSNMNLNIKNPLEKRGTFILLIFKKYEKVGFAAFKFEIVTPPLRGGVTIISFSKKYKKSKVCGFIKTIF